MKKKKLLIKTFVILIFMLFTGFELEVNAADFWNQATNWYSNGSTDVYLNTSIISDIANMVEVVGTAAIAIATVVLGIKYVLGSVTEKADVKDSMVTLLFACLFFFGWSNLRGILIKNVGYDSNGAVTGISGATQLFIFAGQGGVTLENAFATIFSIVIIIAKLIAVLATVYMGVKYIFSGSEGKAKLKDKGVMYIIGILLIFTTLNILSFISDAINNAL